MSERRTDDGGRSWKPLFYGLMGILALVGIGLIGYTLGASRGGEAGSGSPAADGTPSPPAASSPESDDARARFPDQYDTLGVARGPEDAPLVVREFADYQCPHCARFFSTAQKIEEEYVAAGQVRYIFFDFPVTSQHPNAMAAAQAARCAGDQDAYWGMHERLFENQREWAGMEDPLPAFRDYARAIGVDPAGLARCVESGEKRGVVETNRQFAQALGVNSTPTLVVGSRGVRGAVPWSQVKEMIESELRRAGGSPGGGAEAGSDPGSSSPGPDGPSSP